MITYYSIIQCMIFDNILHWIVSKYTKLDDIALHNYNIIYIVYRQKSWVILHILMRCLSKLIFGRVMMNSLMKDPEGHS